MTFSRMGQISTTLILFLSCFVSLVRTGTAQEREYQHEFRVLTTRCTMTRHSEASRLTRGYEAKGNILKNSEAGAGKVGLHAVRGSLGRDSADLFRGVN